MKTLAKLRGSILPAAFLGCCMATNSAFGTEWKQAASVRFIELPWGRYAQITVEYTPDLGDSVEDIGEYMDPAKQAALMEEVQAEAASGWLEGVGRTILITVPGREYGMSGSWNDVRIESGSGISIPPDESHLGTGTSPGEQTHYTGVLTITEFTDGILRGSYRARLFKADTSRRENEARRRDFVGTVAGVLEFDLSPIDAPKVHLAVVPESLSDEDTKLLKRIQAAGISRDVQGQMLEMLRGMDPAMQDVVLENQSNSYQPE